MNHYVEEAIIQHALSSAKSASGASDDPVAAAVVAVEHCLARAHEEGRVEAVRLLHAVLGLLLAAPRH